MQDPAAKADVNGAVTGRGYSSTHRKRMSVADGESLLYHPLDAARWAACQLKLDRENMARRRGAPTLSH